MVLRTDLVIFEAHCINRMIFFHQTSSDWFEQIWFANFTIIIFKFHLIYYRFKKETSLGQKLKPKQKLHFTRSKVKSCRHSTENYGWMWVGVLCMLLVQVNEMRYRVVKSFNVQTRCYICWREGTQYYAW